MDIRQAPGMIILFGDGLDKPPDIFVLAQSDEEYKRVLERVRLELGTESGK